MEEKNKLFRAKTLEQLSTPDELTGYLRVTGPGVWILLAGIIFLLGGMLAWAMFGTMYSRINAPVLVQDGKAMCYILNDDMVDTDDQIEITIGDVDLYADPAEASREIMDASADPALYASGYLSSGKFVYILTAETDLRNGVYDATVTTEAMRPIALMTGNV